MTAPLHDSAAMSKALSSQSLISATLKDFPGRVALVSSFGTESAVLLQLAAQLDKDLPVIFLDTGKLFRQTHEYQKKLTAFLGLTNVRTVRPEPADVDGVDRTGALWRRKPDQCCTVRKVWPLNRALKGFDAWITGRKKFQNTDRDRAANIDTQDGRLVLSPLLNWSKADLDAYFETYDLPRHPLEDAGFSSVGCFTCTAPIKNGDDLRAGRWRGQEKTECGIHLPARPQAT